jgi:hypothetical protein
MLDSAAQRPPLDNENELSKIRTAKEECTESLAPSLAVQQINRGTNKNPYDFSKGRSEFIGSLSSTAMKANKS